MSIFSNYSDFKYIYPPRAESAIDPKLLKDIGESWIAQPKYNGSCTVLFINGHADYKLYNRHAEPLTLQQPINYTALNDSEKYMVLCGEYLNKNKTGENGLPFNHKFIIWDILVWKGEYLLGTSVEERLTILYTLFGSSRGHISEKGMHLFNHLHTTPLHDVFMAPSYQHSFKNLFDELIQTDLYEGLVLKKKNARLDLGLREKNNGAWQFKARKGTRNYQF